MKVIEDKFNNDWTHLITCSGCHSKLEIEAEDVSYESDPRDYSKDYFDIDCPLCKETVSIEVVEGVNAPKIIPNWLFKRLRGY